jgi:hypothetical protein
MRLVASGLAGEDSSSPFSERPANLVPCSHTALAFASSRDSTGDRISWSPSKYLPLMPEYFASVTRLPSACAASSSAERWGPMKFTNQRLVMILFMIGFISLPACVVETTPGDQEFTVMPYPSPQSSIELISRHHRVHLRRRIGSHGLQVGSRAGGPRQIVYWSVFGRHELAHLRRGRVVKIAGTKTIRAGVAIFSTRRLANRK